MALIHSVKIGGVNFSDDKSSNGGTSSKKNVASAKYRDGFRLSIDSTDFDAVDDRVFVVKLSLCVFAFDLSRGRFRCNVDIDVDIDNAASGNVLVVMSAARSLRPSEPELTDIVPTSSTSSAWLAK